MEKVLYMLKSRKFWVSIVGLLVSLGFLEASDVDNAALVEAILVIVTTISYALSIAIEDAGRHSSSQVVVNTPAAPPLTSSFEVRPPSRATEVIVVTEEKKEE